MLELINAERERTGGTPVVLGTNDAAQLHAESSLANCTSGHWGPDGLKPYMRYSLAGGYQSNGENGRGSDYCITKADGYRGIPGIMVEVQKAMDSWMLSPGHRANILDPMHRKVNIGLAWDTYNTKMYQHFEGDHVHYDQMPVISDGVLRLHGRVKNGISLNRPDDLLVMIYYDRPPHPLTAGQLSRTYCYDGGAVVAGLRPPLTDGSRWTTHEFTQRPSSCPSPYDVPADSPAPRSLSEAHSFWKQAYNASSGGSKDLETGKWITARKWDVSGDAFAVDADLRAILDAHGEGVYTVMVWVQGQIEYEAISQYSIFHGITPPGTYNLKR